MLNLEGRELGGCRLIRKIGEGGMGEVYLAEQIRVGNRQVAVKVMRPDSDTYDTQAIENAKRRFEREAATLGKLEHPNILPIYDSGVEDDYFYIVMRYAADGSLADCIRGRSRRNLTLPLGAELTVDIVSQVAAALQFTHDKGVVHRDVKPANVLTQDVPGEQWRMLLADFGVARGLDNTSQRTQVTGTVTYMAPEQFQGQYSPATDQYALAVMTFQFLAGRPPFEGELGAVMRGHMNERPPSLRALNPAVPAGVEAAVMRALAKEPGQRFPSVTAYAQALQTGLRAQEQPPALPTNIVAPVAPPDSTVPRWPGGASAKGPVKAPAKAPYQRGGMGRVWLIALAVVVLVASVVGAGIYVNNQNQATVMAQETETAQASLTQTAGAPTITPTPTQTVIRPGITITAAPAVTPPPLPAGVGSLVFDSAAPSCPGDTVNWNKGSGVTTSCPSSSMVSLVSTTSGTLACLGDGISQPNGYLIAQVSAQAGQVALGFRQGVGDTSGSGYKVTGYYLAVDASGNYVLYSVDHTGATNTITSGTLQSALPPTFYMAALYDGSTLTMTINGQTLSSVSDSAFPNGWVAACTTGSATFSHVKLYNVTQ